MGLTLRGTSIGGHVVFVKEHRMMSYSALGTAFIFTAVTLLAIMLVLMAMNGPRD